jgi:octaprenyl-diphosphate synthase
VLIGDFCYARALQAVAQIGDASALRHITDVVVGRSEAEAARLHGAGACDLDSEQHARIIGSRAAALLGWCGAVGQLLAPRAAAALGAYGHALGSALQIAADIRDCTREPPRARGPAGQELREGKATLPVLLACERSPGLRGELLGLLQGGPPLDEARLHVLLDRVADSGGLTEARAVATSHAEAAQAALAALSPSPARAALEAIARAVVARAQ